MDNVILCCLIGALLWMLYEHRRSTKNLQRTFCYCANCRNELCSDKNTTYTDECGVVTYKCGKCGRKQKFLFDAPVPIYLGEELSHGPTL